MVRLGVLVKCERFIPLFAVPNCRQPPSSWMFELARVEVLVRTSTPPYADMVPVEASEPLR